MQGNLNLISTSMLNVRPEGKKTLDHLYSSNGIEEYTTSVTGFINKCIDDVIPTVTVHPYPNQKPWITDNIHTELKGRAAAFKERDSNPERNPAMPSDEPSNRQSVNTGLRLNHATPGPTLIRCVRACKLLQTHFGANSTETCMRA
jgi:hypothetical protein